MNSTCGPMRYILSHTWFVREVVRGYKDSCGSGLNGYKMPSKMHMRAGKQQNKRRCDSHTALLYINPIKATCFRASWNAWKHLDFHQDVQVVVMSAVHHWL